MPRFSGLLASLVATAAAVSSVTAHVPADQHPMRHLFDRSVNGLAPGGIGKRAPTDYPPILTVTAGSTLPDSWKSVLDAAVADGTIPDLPPSTLVDGSPTYPKSYTNAQIQSWTLTKYVADTDIATSPEGVWAISFDDGPTDESPPLYKYLESQNQAATHFLIGSNCVSYPDALKEAFSTGGDMAVHTWSHNLLTNLTNEQVFGELAWTMQIIYDNFGVIPKLMRPPQGDVDARVRAIASLLNLQTVLWSHDSNDWCLDDNYQTSCPAENVQGQSLQTVETYINNAITGSKNPGVMMLEHEIHVPSIAIFQSYYPNITAAGWSPQPIGNFSDNGLWYSNAADNSAADPSPSGWVPAGTSLSSVASAASTGSMSSSRSRTRSSTAAGSSTSSGARQSQTSTSDNTASGAAQTTGALSAIGLAAVAAVAALVL